MAWHVAFLVRCIALDLHKREPKKNIKHIPNRVPQFWLHLPECRYIIYVHSWLIILYIYSVYIQYIYIILQYVKEKQPQQSPSSLLHIHMSSPPAPPRAHQMRSDSWCQLLQPDFLPDTFGSCRCSHCWRCYSHTWATVRTYPPDFVQGITGIC